MGVSAVDINCDMGEGFGSWRLGDTDDASLFKFISSANIAAGFHGGDPNIMHRTIRLAVEHGVAVGVHPAYRDLQGFGRRRIDGTPEELVNDIAYQVGALGEFARWHGVKLQHVKPHGALFMELAVNEALSSAFIAYMRQVQPRAAIFCMGISVTYGLAKAAGHPVVREFYADRDYDERGSIVFTRHAGRLDPEAVARKVVRACREGKVATVSGTDIAIDFESVCFHSDTPGSLEIVQAIRAGLDQAGIAVAPVGQIMGF